MEDEHVDLYDRCRFKSVQPLTNAQKQLVKYLAKVVIKPDDDRLTVHIVLS